MKLQIAVSRASHIVQKIFPDAVNTKGRSYIAFTARTRSHIATTKKKNKRTNGPVNAHLISRATVNTKTSFAKFYIVLKWVKVNSWSSFI